MRCSAVSCTLSLPQRQEQRAIARLLYSVDFVDPFKASGCIAMLQIPYQVRDQENRREGEGCCALLVGAARGSWCGNGSTDAGVSKY
jgi:hypothetical protein